MRSPDGITIVPGRRPASPCLIWDVTPNRPGLSELSTTQVDRHRAHEVVPLLAGVLADSLDELGAEGVLDVGEAGVVVGG